MDIAATQELNVLLVEDDKQKAQSLIGALDRSQYCIRHITTTGMPLLKQVEALQPDVIVIDVESPSRDVLESLSIISLANPKPIVMFSEQNDTETISQSVKSGVSAYIAGDIAFERVRSILDTAVARFSEYQLLKKELVHTKQKLSSQRVVEQAKIWLMETKNLTEKEAYHRIRKMAMDNSQKLEEVARSILSLAKMLEKSS
ncbi:ANTAR domain-containing protein [Thalassotalea sp. M1531]|uniref:ANTAR domain-containing protein n=1 Tax=Thalassotalea algicola TaxID=2716224 RepID=A0A7Y0LDC2_9GAMM|nr:ANTAR domain-containing protein [Thalassotalea algicola]NMP32458.1 ANTAR domain-containing protein [Thalassotalea algicola]